jgi:hypothetical protein
VYPVPVIVSGAVLVLWLQSAAVVTISRVAGTGMAEALNVIALEMQATLGLALALPLEK